MRSFVALMLFFATSLGATAAQVGKIVVSNHCRGKVYIWQSNHDDCNRGSNQFCYGDRSKGPVPWTIPSGQSTSIDIIANDFGTSMKIQRVSHMEQAPSLQLEYTISRGHQMAFWDLSNIDGNGPARTGSPFGRDNVLVRPMVTQSVEQFPTCTQIFCKANEICRDAYQFPDQLATKVCPSSGMSIMVDLCLPGDSSLIQKKMSKRSVSFSA